jgi:hypothetical protein
MIENLSIVGVSANLMLFVPTRQVEHEVQFTSVETGYNV